jgi:CRISPR-associated protein Cas1
MQLHLNTYGAYLHVKDQLFEIKIKEDKEVKKHHVAAIKVKSIWLSKGTALSTDAVHLAIKNNIDIVFLEYDGFPLGRVWHSKLGSTTLIRKKQLEASLSPLAVKYTQQWLTRKVGNQAQFIRQLKKHREQHHEYLDDKIDRIEQMCSKIEHATANDIKLVAEQYRGWEGTAGRLFFETLSFVLPKQYQFSGRSFRPAKDPYNAFLNYAYGLLYSRIEKVLILAGLDPFVGFLHRDDYNYKSMVYDFIEPYRVFADKVVFSLFTAKKVRQDFTEHLQSGIRIHKEGKVLLIEAFNKYFEEEKVRYKGRNQTRINIIQADAHVFANELIQKELPI